MDAVNTWEVVAARAELRKVMTDACDITRRTRVDDEYGGQTDATVPVVQDVPCLVVPSGLGAFTDNIVAGRESNEVDVTLSVPFGTPIQQGDVVFISTIGPRRLVVTRVLDMDSLPLCLDVECDYVDSSEEDF